MFHLHLYKNISYIRIAEIVYTVTKLNICKEKRQFFKKEIFYHGVEIITTREITKTTFRRVHLWAG